MSFSRRRGGVVSDPDPGVPSGLGAGWPLWAFGSIWLAAVGVAWLGAGTSPTNALTIMAIVGLGFSLLAWLSTRSAGRATAAPPATRAQLAAVALLVLAITAYLTWGRGLLAGVLPGGAPADGTAGALASDLSEKVLAFVVVPVLVFRAGFGFGSRDLGLPRPGAVLRQGRWKPVLVVGGAFVAFQTLAGQGARPIMRGEFGSLALIVGLPVALLWLVVEVGLVEEVFFRAIVQDRLSAATRNGWAGITGGALLFGLAHAPGRYLRGAGVADPLGAAPTGLEAVSYSVAVVAVAGLFLGVLWERTRSLPVVVLVHALADLLTNAPELLRLFDLD
jgi:membrane protease YdiL (CAAX protease family)